MAEGRSYVDANTRERERMRALVEGLNDDALMAPVNEYWTVAGVLGHIAYWDIRVLVLAEKIDRGEPWAAGDAEPDGDWLNDSTRPLIHAIRPRDAAEFALRIAEQTDARVAELPLDRLYPHDPASPIDAGRGEHRGEHLDEIEAALRARR
jgi:hypothetical protein